MLEFTLSEIARKINNHLHRTGYNPILGNSSQAEAWQKLVTMRQERRDIKDTWFFGVDFKISNENLSLVDHLKIVVSIYSKEMAKRKIQEVA